MNTAKLGQKIKFFRERANLSQFELENEIGGSAGSISRIENGKVNPTKETLEKIAKVLALNDYEFSYLAGKFADPVSPAEVDKAKLVVDEYFSKKSTFAYMVDERSRVWAVSKGFLKLLGMQDFEGIAGNSILEYITKTQYGVRKYLEGEEYEKMMKDLLIRMYHELSFMIQDEWYMQTLNIIEDDDVLYNIWKDIQLNPKRDFNDASSRKVNFNINKIAISMVYGVEPVLHNERFRVVDYVPDNKIVRYLSGIL